MLHQNIVIYSAIQVIARNYRVYDLICDLVCSLFLGTTRKHERAKHNFCCFETPLSRNSLIILDRPGNLSPGRICAGFHPVDIHNLGMKSLKISAGGKIPPPISTSLMIRDSEIATCRGCVFVRKP
jgi:hypothetical protein